MTGVLHIENLLDESACAALRAELSAAAGVAASLLGVEEERAVRLAVRRTTRLKIPTALAARVTGLLMAQKGRLAHSFGVTLDRCEEPQFLRYGPGDFFVAHQDGNTPLIHDDTRFRKVSVVLFLSRASDAPSPGTYGGGELVMHGPYTGPILREPVNAAPGTLVAFRAETTHEVTPVTHGERFTIVSWFR